MSQITVYKLVCDFCHFEQVIHSLTDSHPAHWVHLSGFDLIEGKKTEIDGATYDHLDACPKCWVKIAKCRLGVWSQWCGGWGVIWFDGVNDDKRIDNNHDSV